MNAVESSPSRSHDSYHTLIEEMRSLDLNKKRAKLRAIPFLSTHPASCQCNPCSNPQHLISVTLLLHSWARLFLDHDQPMLTLSVLQDAGRYFQWMVSKLAHAGSDIGVPDPKACPVFLRLCIQNAHLIAKALLVLGQHSAAMDAASDVLSWPSSSSFLHDPLLRLDLAGLHLTLARSSLADLWQRDPDLSASLWHRPGGRALGRLSPSNQERDLNPSGVGGSKPATGGTRRKRTQTRSRAGRQQPSRQRTTHEESKSTAESSGWLGLAPPSLHPVLTHLLTAYQLCYPGQPSLLLQDVCQLLALCITSWDSLLATHLLLSSCHTSLSHQALCWFGRKIR